MRAGVVIFVIPFVFAFYPELLLIEPAQINPVSGADRYLPGYDGGIQWTALAILLPRVALAFYLLASVLARFDTRRIGRTEALVRLALTVLVLMKAPWLFSAAIAAAIAVLVWHRMAPSRPAPAAKS